MLRVGHRCLSLGGCGRVGGGGLWGVSIAVDDLLAVGLRGSEGLRVSRAEQVVVGGGELDDGRVLACPEGTCRLSWRASVDQDRPVRVGHQPSSLLIKARAAAQALAPAGVHDGRALLLETCVLARKAGAEALAGGHAGEQAVVWMEDAALVMVVGMRGQAQDLGHGKTHVVCFILIYRLCLDGRSCEEKSQSDI